jgi:predicted membrane channel-forming protein YqfA (hemolysin III family)
MMLNWFKKTNLEYDNMNEHTRFFIFMGMMVVILLGILPFYPLIAVFLIMLMGIWRLLGGSWK